jgi:endoglucanase
MERRKMKRILPILLFLLISLPACSSVYRTDLEYSTEISGSSLVPTDAPSEFPDAFGVKDRLGRGVNFGNALEAPTEGEWGVTLREEYLDLIQDAGFDSVRLPVRWSTHADESSPYTIDPVFFARVDEIINWALDRGLWVVLDTHHYVFPTSALYKEMDRYLSIWQQVAEHYADYPSELVFEILNEPDNSITANQWNAIADQALDVIRTSNPRRTVIIGGIYWNSYDQIGFLELPDADPYLIATFHYYLPFEFTHQGAEWAEGSDAWLGTTWEGTEAEKNDIINNFDLVSDWAEEHNRPIYLGEFGAYSKADMSSRVSWTTFMREQAEAHGFAWAYWEFCAGFGIYDPEAGLWQDDLLHALIP